MRNTLQLMYVLFLFLFISSCQKEFLDPVTYDLDAQKFIDSSGITDKEQKSALNNFVVQLKDSSLWTKFMAIYPMIGGSESSNKWNLKDPRNSDDAYRLSFTGNPVFAKTGILFPTPSDYANSHVVDAMLIYNDNAISYFSRTQNTVDGYDMGCADHQLFYNEFAIYNTVDASVWFGYNVYGAAPTNTKGLFILSSTLNDVRRYDNGLLTHSKNTPPTVGSTGMPILIGTVYGASAGGQRECALATIGKGLTDAEAMMFNKIAWNLQIALGR